jgi:hypothetical protein
MARQCRVASSFDLVSRAPRREGPGHYAEFVAQGRDVKLWEEALSGQIYLGDEAFVQQMQAYALSPDAVDIHSAAVPVNR